MIRNDINKKSISLIKANKILALEFATGVGKSKIALDIVNKLKTSNYKVLLVVAELAHIKNWEDEAQKWGYIALYNSITVVTYASLKKHQKLNYDLIILDEAHHIGSEVRLDILDNISFNKMLLLSATLNDTLKYQLSALLNVSIKTYKITMQQAIDLKLLSEPKIYLIPLLLNNKNYTETIVEEWGKSNLRKTYKCTYSDRWDYLKKRKEIPNATLEISCTPFQKYLYLTEQFNYYKKIYIRNKNEAIKNKWLQMGSKRKRFLGESKTPVIKKFLIGMEGIRYICFCSSIDQAVILGGENSIHSKKDNSAEIIQKFNSKENDSLFAVGMLQEGQNLVDIEAGIIVQLDGQDRSFIQKFGRSMRAEDPVQYIFYYQNTRDAEYLENVLEGINKQYVKELGHENND